MSREKLQQFDKDNKLHWNSKGKPNRRVFLDEYKGQPTENLWTDIYVINPMARERVNYDTQKPESLLSRIIETSCKPGGRVADFYSGSGTTAAVAERLGYNWVVSDLGKPACMVTRKRLIDQDAKPFLYQHIGDYQVKRRQPAGLDWWQHQSIAWRNRDSARTDPNPTGAGAHSPETRGRPQRASFELFGVGRATRAFKLTLSVQMGRGRLQNQNRF